MQAIAFGGDLSWLTMPGRSIIDSWLQSQSSLDRRTRPKSKSGSRALPQKTLEDDGSIKLSILVSEQTSWLSIFTLWQRHLDGAERNKNITIFFGCYCTSVVCCYFDIYRRIPQLRPPPFVHASIGQNRGEGLFAGSWYLHVTTVTDRRRARDLCTFSGCLMGKTWKKWQSKK